MHYSTRNQYSLCGIFHFFQKYGVPLQINDDKGSKISIIYGNETYKGGFIIRICEEEIKDDVFALRILQNLDLEEVLNNVYKLYITHSEKK